MFVRILTHMRSQLVGYLALFIALGGTSYAVVKLPAGSVTSREVKNRSLLSVDFRRGQLPRGEQGPAGPQGPPGDPANFDASLYYTKTDSDARFLGKAAKAADADKLDGLDSSAFAQMLYASVVYDSSTGTLTFSGRGVTSVTRSQTGLYRLFFNRSLTGCGATGALSVRTGGAELMVGPAFDTSVRIDIRQAGTSAGMRVDKDFVVVVVC